MAEPTVIIRRSSLGDVVLLGAVTKALSGPVHVVTHPRYAGVARRLIGVDDVVTWPDGATASEMVAKLPPGELVDLQNSIGSIALCLASGRRSRRIRKHSVTRRMRIWLKSGPPRPHVTQLYADAVQVEPAPAPWIHLPDRTRDTLALVPGASKATKRWHPDAYATVGRSWQGPVVVLGGPGEQALCERVADGVPGAATLCEDGFGRTLDALASTRVAVAGDTGLMHLAGACGVSVVGIFGPTDPNDGFWVWPGEPVRRQLECSPCSLHGDERCPEGHHRCMDLPVDAVIGAVRDASAG